MQTETLIETLTAHLTPVRRTRSPARLTLLWLGISVPVLALMVAIMGPRPGLGSLLLRSDFALAEGLAALTALVSAYAAFCAGRPDQPGWKLWLPVALMAAWLAVLGRQCLLLSANVANGALTLHWDTMCVPAIAMTGLIPAIAMAVLLRRSPLFRTTHACLCGAMAAAAGAEFSLRLFHPDETLTTLLVWQMGSVALFTLAGSTLGRWLLRGKYFSARRPFFSM